MSDKVKQVAERILERTKDQIGTHWIGCHEYHLECFAVFVVRQLPDVVREAKAEAWDEGYGEGEADQDCWDGWRYTMPDRPVSNPHRTEGES